MNLDPKNTFYWFHMHPELSYKEYETTAKIKEILGDIGVEILESSLETGVVAIVRAKADGMHDTAARLALRCDIDALPIEEKSGLSYSSCNKGVMHACGHDFHTTALLLAAQILETQKEKLKRDVLLIFQPAEEAPGGALKVMETGLLDNIETFFAIHTASDHKPGCVGISEGAVMAAVDRFEVNIQGVGTHAGHPDKGIDPIVAAASVVQSLQTIISRNLSPFAPGLVSITHIEGGNTWNVIPENVYMEGTIRSMSPEDRTMIKERFENLVKSVSKAYGAHGNVVWHEGPPAVINDAGLCEEARRAAKEAGLIIEKAQPSLGGEDFSYYLQSAKGAFIRMGTGGDYPNHHPAFTASAEALEGAAAFLAQLAFNCNI